jgi:bla regulator protein BlaR1
MLRHPSPRSLGVRLSTAAAAVVALALIAPVRPIARSSSGFAPAPDVAVEQQTAESPAKEKLNYIFFVDDDHTTMSGATEDVERARRLKRPGEPMLWFRHGGREYVLRDPATLRRIAAMWGPANAIGDAQGQLGGKQGALGATQGMIGARQGELGAQQGMIGDRQSRLADQRSELERRVEARGEGAALEADRRRLDAEMRALDREMAQLDSRMRELDKPMRELDAQMRALDQDMRLLDAKMREVVERAEAEMRALITRAIASGDAELVK